MTTTDLCIELARAPAVEGLRFRRYSGERDIAAMVDVANAAAEANGDTERQSVTMLRSELANPTHIRPGEAMLLAFVDERLVAFSAIEYADTTDGERHYHSLGNVHPDQRRRGIGGAMMDFDESALRELAAQDGFPGPRFLTTWLHDADAGGLALCATRGYRRARVGHLMARPDLEDIDVPPLPDGLELRPVTREMLPQVWEAMTEAFRDHPGGQDHSQAAYRRWCEDPLMDPRLLLVAFDGDEVTAGVQAAIDPEENAAQGYLRGWTDPVFTRRAWRRRGIARALLGHALTALKEHGMTSAQLGVDSENPSQALFLYQRHRFEIVRSASQWQKRLGS